MRALLTTPTYPPYNSGLGNAVQQQAACLVSQGVDVVVATGGNKRRSRLDDKTGVLVEEFSISGSLSPLDPIRGEYHQYRQFLIQQSFDVIIMNAWQTWSTDLILTAIENIPGKKILYSHCISTNLFFAGQPIRSSIRYLAWRPYWWKMREYLKQLDSVIFLAEYGDDTRFDDLRLARKIGVNIEIIPNSLSDAAVRVLAKPVLGKDSRAHIISVGSYNWQKGFDFVLKSYALSQCKNEVPLKLFGQKKSGYTCQLQRLATQLGISRDYISFCEGVSGPALLDEYQKSYLIINGSRTECQPLVLLDANATGTPFIARNTGCISRMSGGISISSPEEAAAQIDDILSSKQKWSHFSGEGRMAAVEKYHPNCVSQKFLRLINNVFKSD